MLNVQLMRLFGMMGLGHVLWVPLLVDLFLLLHSLAVFYKECAFANDVLTIIEDSSRSVLELDDAQVMRYVSNWNDMVGVLDNAVQEQIVKDRPPIIRFGDI